MPGTQKEEKISTINLNIKSERAPNKMIAVDSSNEKGVIHGTYADEKKRVLVRTHFFHPFSPIIY
ncbi:hypothetical protein GCM10011571_05200 [Marinithermofilum abyssi]|uniref:Uncharacterized protein n=1 Tax=Marinithermofilum abyssi TaxID=1571185 RepID=A0A8J2VD97_9BACL|nr:hypothetical protein GCM10011571_05200 [Marinithermofilum abyssi]